jgi:hypothetical protein
LAAVKLVVIFKDFVGQVDAEKLAQRSSVAAGLATVLKFGRIARVKFDRSTLKSPYAETAKT